MSLEEIIEAATFYFTDENDQRVCERACRGAVREALALAREQISDQGRPDETQRNIGLMVAAQVCDDLAATLKDK
jgi:hypothetical protein